MNLVTIDNNTSDLELLENTIKEIFPQCQVSSFADPLMSAKYICNNDVDLVFIAVEMKPVDGFILMRTLRANKPKLPIIMVSNNDMYKERTTTLEDCCYIVKPTSSEILLKTIAKLLI